MAKLEREMRAKRQSKIEKKFRLACYKKNKIGERQCRINNTSEKKNEKAARNL